MLLFELASIKLGGKIVFCQQCGTKLSEGAGFCSNCGGSAVGQQPPQAQPVQQQFAPQYSAPRPTSPGNTLSTIGIICGAIAFLILPPVFGIAGLVFGGIAKAKGESRATTALIVSGLGLVLGMIIGALVMSA